MPIPHGHFVRFVCQTRCVLVYNEMTSCFRLLPFFPLRLRPGCQRLNCVRNFPVFVHFQEQIRAISAGSTSQNNNEHGPGQGCAHVGNWALGCSVSKAPQLPRRRLLSVCTAQVAKHAAICIRSGWRTAESCLMTPHPTLKTNQSEDSWAAAHARPPVSDANPEI